MDSTSYVSEAIRYQKIASDQFFQLMSYCQNSSEELLQKTLDQCIWLPGDSKESCLDWSASCRETTKFLQEIVDSGFEQAEQIFVYPAKKVAGEKRSQPKQAAAPSQKTARQEKTSPAPKRKARTTAKGEKKPAAAKDEASKSAPLKAMPPERGDAAPSTPISAAEKNVAPEAAPPQSAVSKSNTQSSAAAGGVKTPTTSSTPSTSTTSTS